MAAISGHPCLLGTTPAVDEPRPRVLDRAIGADAVGHLCGERRYVYGAGGMHAGEAGWRSWHRAS